MAELPGGGGGGGGLALFIDNSYLFTEVQFNTPLQAVAARVALSKAVTVCNIYIPPSVDVSLSDLERLIQQLPTPFVLVGDFNAHSPLWGDVRQDSWGQMVEKLLDDYYNLCLLNTGEPTYRHHSHHSFFVPDLSVIHLLNLTLRKWSLPNHPQNFRPDITVPADWA